VRWHNKIELSHAAWHKAGDSELEYDPATLRRALETLAGRLAGGDVITDVAINADECQQHIALIDLLVRSKYPARQPDNQTKTAEN
jgi:hypothetical protein